MKLLRAAWPVIILLESLSSALSCHNLFVIAFVSTPITATIHHRRRARMCRINQHHQGHCRPLMAFHSSQQQGGLYSTFRHKKKQQLTSVYATNKKGGNSQDKTIEINSPSSQQEGGTNIIISKLSSITETITSSKTAKGRAILLLVSFLYGTLNVSLRAIYASDGAPAASVLSLVRQCLSVLTFIPIIISVNSNKKGGEETSFSSYLDSSNTAGNGKDDEETKRPMWIAAFELAFWNFGAQGLINAGLLFSPAARASFLTQTSVVLTPLISAVAGETINSSVWGGCALALVGLFLISTSSVDSAAVIDASISGESSGMSTVLPESFSFNQGDAMILLGALSWSFYIFRTSQIAKKYSELDLQFTKTALLAGMYGAWFLSTAAATLQSGGTLLSLWSGWQSLPVWILLVYSAAGPGAIADLLQQQGQKEVSASESNIILCLESIFAAFVAFFLLGEVSSLKEVIGGLFIVVAAILASK
jgi:drug/metabolite transporter (DMT)-like permease